MIFDPVTTRKYLLEFVIQIYREAQFSEVLSKNVLNGYGSSMFTTALDCFLVGMFDDGREILSKSLSFLGGAVEHKQHWADSDGGEQFLQLRKLALCSWLNHTRHEARLLEEAVRWEEQWFESHDSDKPNVQLTLVTYLDAGEYETLMRRYEIAGIKEPRRLRSIRGEGTMAYVMAQHRLGLKHTAEEIQDALQSFLRRNVDGWLDYGHAATAAQWMKIALWQPGDDPIATLLRCYDYLPGREAPAYPPLPIAAKR